MELSGEFILELTEEQQRLFGFLYKWLADREQAREVLQRTNLVLCRKADDYELDHKRYLHDRVQVIAILRSQ